jgi:peptide/nickel transport system permease protein/oligopeptide transport system permease protein
VTRYIARRLLLAVPVCLLASFMIFVLVYVLPGDPIRALAGDRPLDEGTVAVLRDRYNLDDPLVVQYLKYVGGVLRGDLGRTFDNEPVADILRSRFGVTLRLALTAFVFQAVIGVIAGVIAALRKGKFLDHVVMTSIIVAISIPSFVLAFLAQIVIGVELGLLPVAGISDGWRSYILPAMVLAAASLAYVTRLMRSSLIESLQSQYITTAIGCGLPRRRVVGVHALRNSLIPVVTFLGIDLGNLLGGAIIIESIFNIPGIGQALYEAIQLQEGPVVVAVVTILVLVYILTNLAVDIVYALLDPRVRYTER